MSKVRGISYQQKIINALKSLPNPLEDKRHNLLIYFVNDRARSNETRFAHIANVRHDLSVSDIRRIPRELKNSILKKDKERTDTFNLYIQRFSYTQSQYIKISLQVLEEEPDRATVKTIYITNIIK